MKIYRCQVCDFMLTTDKLHLNKGEHIGHKLKLASTGTMAEYIKILWWKFLYAVFGK